MREREQQHVRGAVGAEVVDDGESWTTVFDADGGDPDHNQGTPTDFVTDLAYDPQHPDDVYAVFSHFELSSSPHPEHTFTGFMVRRSRDGGATWTDLGTGDIPAETTNLSLTVGVDSRYLYAATAKGVFRIALRT